MDTDIGQDDVEHGQAHRLRCIVRYFILFYFYFFSIFVKSRLLWSVIVRLLSYYYNVGRPHGVV